MLVLLNFMVLLKNLMIKILTLSNDFINNLYVGNNELKIKDFDECHFIEIICLIFENVIKEIFNLII